MDKTVCLTRGQLEEAEMRLGILRELQQEGWDFDRLRRARDPDELGVQWSTRPVVNLIREYRIEEEVLRVLESALMILRGGDAFFVTPNRIDPSMYNVGDPESWSRGDYIPDIAAWTVCGLLGVGTEPYMKSVFEPMDTLFIRG